jgi:nucleoside-diphosphate-sugar epimerase
LVRDLCAGRAPNIRNPFNAQDFVYVGDVAEAMRLALTTDAEPGIYNVGSGQAATVLDMCRLAEDALAASVRHSDVLAARSVPPESTRFWANPSKTMSALNWQCRYSLSEGVRRQVEAIRGELRDSGQVSA